MGAQTPTRTSLVPSSSSHAKLAAVLALGAALRLGLFATGLPTALRDRVELVTPITSLKGLKEGVYLLHNKISPYSGGPFHQSPILLTLFSTVLPVTSRFCNALCWTAADVGAGWLLGELKRWKSGSGDDGVWKVAALYLFNPLTLVSALSQSTILFSNLAVLSATFAATQGNIENAMLFIALASSFSLYPVLLVPALVLLLVQSGRRQGFNGGFIGDKRTVITAVANLILSASALVAVSRYVAGSWNFVRGVYGTILLVDDLTPNIGLWWYFFIEMFDHFRDFFLMAFQLHVLIYAAPVTIRHREDPLFAITILSGIMATFKSYPSLGDTCLFLGLLSLHDEIAPYLRYPFFSATVHLYALFLLPTFYHLWIYDGSGNANFFYAVTLVWALGGGALILDAVWAWGRRKWETEGERGRAENGSAVVQM